MSGPVLSPTLLSLQIALCSTALVLPVATALAWLLRRLGVGLGSLLTALVNLPLVLPPVVTGYLLLHLVSPRGPLGSALRAAGVSLAFSWGAAVLASAVVALPLAVWTIKTAMDAIEPGLEDAARLLGRSEWQVLAQITLPLSARGVLGGAVLAFARSLGEFGATIVVAGMTPGETLTLPGAVYLYLQQPGQEGRVHALVLLAVALSSGSLLVVQHLQRPRPAHRGAGRLEASRSR